MGLKWDKARRQDRVTKYPEWVPPPAPKNPDDIEDTRTIREKIADGEIGRG